MRPSNHVAAVRPARMAFTLVELLVVIAIMGILTSLLLPAVNSAREAARRTRCANSMRQVALAVINYEASYKVFPPSFCFTPNTTGGQWSALARVLPFMEGDAVYKRIDFKTSYDFSIAADGTKVKALRIPTLICPSEPNDIPRESAAGIEHYPANYAVNVGTWMVHDPNTNRPGDGAFAPNSAFTPAGFRDGLSRTLCLAEVKAYTPYYRDGGLIPANIPALPSEICGFGGQAKMGQITTQNTGHTEWVDGKANQTGFTTVFGPNTKVLCVVGGAEYDVDWVNMRESKSATIPTFAALTARSYHPGCINVCTMDASVHVIMNEIDLQIWRALSTRRSGDWADVEPLR